ncbi:MAG: hypothetical protein WCZ90_19270 [Melioribacteraceae bacterium]
MKKLRSSIYFSTVKGTFVIVLAITIAFTYYGCKDDNLITQFSNSGITVEIRNSETYKYQTVSGDEEGATIKVQAEHYDISEIKRNSETNFAAVYTYKPKSNFVGYDYVVLETQKGSDGASASTEIKTIKINFVVSR